MNNLSWSILTNILYLGWTWAQSKAFILANYIPQDSDSQTAAAADMEANKNAGANIVGAAASAPGDRTNSWYVQSSPFSTQLPAPLASFPAQPAAGDVGKVATLSETGVEWDAASGGGGVDTLAAVGSAPNANSGVIASTTLTLEPADYTHPGVLKPGVQVLTSGNKGVDRLNIVAASDHSTPVVALGNVSDNVYGLWGYPAPLATPLIGGDIGLGWDTGGQMYLQAYGSGNINFLRAGTTKAVLGAASLDLTGLGVTGSIKIKSADGTTWTLTVDNAGTLVIA